MKWENAKIRKWFSSRDAPRSKAHETKTTQKKVFISLFLKSKEQHFKGMIFNREFGFTKQQQQQQQQQQQRRPNKWEDRVL